VSRQLKPTKHPAAHGGNVLFSEPQGSSEQLISFLSSTLLLFIKRH
jgi:hypothetical protein